eukprot:gene22150-biopygen8723
MHPPREKRLRTRAEPFLPDLNSFGRIPFCSVSLGVVLELDLAHCDLRGELVAVPPPTRHVSRCVDHLLHPCFDIQTARWLLYSRFPGRTADKALVCRSPPVQHQVEKENPVPVPPGRKVC